MKYILNFLSIVLYVSATKIWKFATNYAVTVMNFQPNLMEVNLTTEPISLAVLGLTGFWDMKENVNDQYKVCILLTMNIIEFKKIYLFSGALRLPMELQKK